MKHLCRNTYVNISNLYGVSYNCMLLNSNILYNVDSANQRSAVLQNNCDVTIGSIIKFIKQKVFTTHSYEMEKI